MTPAFPSWITVGIAAMLLAGCVSQEEYLKKEAEADRLGREVSAMSGRKADLEKELESLGAERLKLEAERDSLASKNEEADKTIRELRSRIVELEGDAQMLKESMALMKKNREEEVRTVSKTYENLLDEMKEEIQQGQIAITELKGKLTVDVVDKILFDSGKAEIKKEGMEVLKKVVQVLRNVEDKSIRVEGHTDNIPISGALAKRYPTNWELSAARAINVTRYLENQGIDPALLSAAAFGEHQPVADNETPEGRAKNRRIAIILQPME